jgi:hypothetical protein
MKKLITTLVGALLAVSIANAAQVGGSKKIDDPNFDGYEGEYKYSYQVTYVDFRGNTVTGTSWNYVTVSGYTLSECQSALSSANYWGAITTQYCHGV